MNGLRKVFVLCMVAMVINAKAFDISKATIVYDMNDVSLVPNMAVMLAEDIYRVSGTRPSLSTKMVAGYKIILGTNGNSHFVDEEKRMDEKWECYDIKKNRFAEYEESWKSQVMANRKDFVVTLPLDSSRSVHTLSLHIVDPGQIVQKITYRGNKTRVP